MKGNPASGITLGNGAAINIPLGWIPSFVQVWNVTDGDIVTSSFIDPYTMTFTSGGTHEIAAGDTIKGATSGATAFVSAVILSSGSWAGGDAAGIFVLDKIVGTFQSEAVYEISDSISGTDDATGAAQAVHSVKIDTAAATVTTTSALLPYVGTSLIPKGFTIGSVVAEEAKILRWMAWRADQINDVTA
jgi:hypothetical protein